MKETQEEIFYELTIPQKSILMSEQFFGEPHIFVIPAWACIKDKINFEVLEQAINYTVKNHDAHRTRFIKMGEKTYQYFENYTPFDVEKIVVDGLEELEDYIKSITFDIYNHTPIKFVMFENVSGDGGFCCILHHLIGDAWSLSLILEETLKSYDQLLQNGVVKDMRVSSYKTFIDSEKSYLTSEKFQKDKAYWEEKFNKGSELITFRNTNNLFETASVRKTLNVPENIVKHCRENKISMFSFFFAAISIYFSRIANSNEIIIGTPFLNRTNAKEKNSMGMFISTLPFKQEISPDMSISDYIKDITISQLGALRHQKISIRRITKILYRKIRTHE